MCVLVIAGSYKELQGELQMSPRLKPPKYSFEHKMKMFTIKETQQPQSKINLYKNRYYHSHASSEGFHAVAHTLQSIISPSCLWWFMIWQHCGLNQLIAGES